MSDAAPPGTGAASRILDRGYRRFEGERGGLRGAVRSVTWQSARAVFGLGRRARAKVFPAVSVVIAYVPAMVFVGLAALLPDELMEDGGIIPDYAGYYGFITAAILLFAAVVAPVVLVDDRTNGMLSLYLSTPLGRGTYLLAKGLAVLGAIALVTVGPPLLLLVAYTLLEVGPGSVGDWAAIFVRIVVAGFAVAAAFTSISLAAASLTTRRSFASVGVVVVVLVSSTIARVLVENAGADDVVLLFSLFEMPFELVQRIYGQPGELPEISTGLVVAANVAWTLLGLAVTAVRYRRLTVTG